ncbi:hypothetical protein EMCRGX_G021830 [Ephydatia muelleri]
MELRPSTPAAAIKDCDCDLYPNVRVLLQIACTLPVTSCDSPLGVPSPQLLALSSSSVNVTTCGPSSPLILNTNSSSMSLQWNAPLQPDYVITAYTLHHRVPSLKSQSEMWAPPSMATVQFHTYNPSSILFYLNSVMTDFLGVKLHSGLPWLIFDVGSGPAVVGSNSTRTFNDGQWHTSPPVGSNLCDGQRHVVLFEQALNTFYVTVDMVHMAAITTVIVPLLTMKHVSYPLLNGNLGPSGGGCLPVFETSLTDNGLNPFTEYVYSVTSLNSAGSADSSWSLTQEGGTCTSPSDVSSPLVVMATSSSITVNGRPQLACWGSPDHDLQRAGTTDDTSDCCDRFATSNHIFGLHVYTVHVAASTVGGQGVGPPAAISTLEFVPIGVQSPVVVSEGTHFLHLEWLPPAQPNGATVVYSGANPQATVTGPSPATLYFFSEVAYNAGGSTQSNASSVTTIESSTDGVPFPNVTIDHQRNSTRHCLVHSTCA